RTELDLEVFLDEEAGVLEARAEHAVVALLDDLRGPRRVHHVQVGREERAGGASYGEVSLVIPHDGDHDLVRKREVLLVEPARHDEWVLDEREALLHEEIVRDELAVEALGGALERL